MSALIISSRQLVNVLRTEENSGIFAVLTISSHVNVNIRMYKKWNIIMYKKYLKEPQNPLPNYCLNVAF